MNLPLKREMSKYPHPNNISVFSPQSRCNSFPFSIVKLFSPFSSQVTALLQQTLFNRLQLNKPVPLLHFLSIHYKPKSPFFCHPLFPDLHCVFCFWCCYFYYLLFVVWCFSFSVTHHPFRVFFFFNGLCWPVCLLQGVKQKCVKSLSNAEMKLTS